MQALIIIDMQHWMFRLAERGRQLPLLMPRINALAEKFVAAGLPVFDVRTFHKAGRSTWSRLMLKHDYPCLIEGTFDAEPVEGLEVPAAAQQVSKTRNSVFLWTDLGERLRKARVDTLAICGVFIEACVGLSASDAEQQGYEVTLVDDAIGHRSETTRSAFFEWLVFSYESKIVDTKTLIGGL